MNNGAKFDLASLDTGANTHEFRLVHPDTGDETPIWITVRSVDSDAYQRAIHELGRKERARFSRARKAQEYSYEENTEATAELLVTNTVTWRCEPGTTLDGAPFPEYTPAAAKALYLRFKWVRRAVDREMQEQRNFLPRSASA